MTGVIDIAAIRVGSRHRKDMGDLDGLAADIAEIGLLQPIVVTPDRCLIAGERRLRACRSLGWPTIPAHVVDLAEIVRGEFSENAFRKDFLPSEIDAIRRALAPLEKAAAKARMSAGGKGVVISTPSGKTRDKIGAFAGVSGKQVDKIAAVVAAAEAEPDKYSKLVADMDKSGRVNGAYRRLCNIRSAERIRAEPPPLPGNGPYRGGLIDIPWAYEPDDENASARGVLPYPTMSIDEACALDVRSLIASDAVVGVWVTNFILAAGLHVPILKAWGLEPKTVTTWPKERIGRGHWAKGQTEHIVIATRGKPTVTLTDQTTLLKGPFHLVTKGAHSAKPIEAYAYFESLFPAPRYFDLFSRHRHSELWDCWGDEAPACVARPDYRRRVAAP
jgi:N6-adenosine-specific RNA methylase IME4